ncbi:MAG TPA: alpha-amylase family glycosyl hydrolase [Herpetosiphonaceae bacterium]|nr:alpha-amylase family glycosyl hydrolase [Herpetosiphonaceae bacterium]
MPTDIYDEQVTQTIQQMQEAAIDPTTKPVNVGAQTKQVPYPFPSPGDWRDTWIYFLMIDRFNNPDASPRSMTLDPPIGWNQTYDYRQGGTFRGVQDQLDYIAALGARAIWLSPVLKNTEPEIEFNYHGYWTQDFLQIDERFASDGTRATAERELMDLIDAAHARGLYVILDIVINHAGPVFDYLIGGRVEENPQSAELMNRPSGAEPEIAWLSGQMGPGARRPGVVPVGTPLGPEDGVWPRDLQRPDFFRRRGLSIDDSPGWRRFVAGDFANGRQLVVEYEAGPGNQEALWRSYGKTPVLSILIRCYQYLIAKYDIDGFRLDAIKHVQPEKVEIFGNAIREFALSVGKRNFFTFAEVATPDEQTIASFVGRNSSNPDTNASFGIDAALDFPLFSTLNNVLKGVNRAGVEQLRELYQQRKRVEEGLLSSHGEAGRYFVTFIDNHDQSLRFDHRDTPATQVTQALALLICLQGIPCLYYGTEQGLQTAVDAAGNPLDERQGVREALWGKPEPSFDTENDLYRQIRELAGLRAREAALRYGRQYFRPVSRDRQNFGLSYGAGGIIAFSRILSDREVLIVANTSTVEAWMGYVVVDLDTNRTPRRMSISYSNRGTNNTRQVEPVPGAVFWDRTMRLDQADTVAIRVELAVGEVQILTID